MEATYTIQHQKYTGSTTVDGYPKPADFQAPVSRVAYGWFPSSGHSSVSASSMSGEQDYTRRVITSKVVMVPDTSPYSVRDQIVLPGETDPYFVSEDVRNYTTGPFGYQPGGEIVVEKVTG